MAQQVLPAPPRLTDPAAGIGLRGWGAEGDAAALAAAWSEPSIRRWTTVPDDRSEVAAERWAAGAADRQRSGRVLDLVVHDLADAGPVLGEVGLVVVDADRRWAEAGWWLRPDARGRGRASAALGLLTRWALGEAGLARLFARTDPRNPAAGAVAERAGWHRRSTLADGRILWVAPASGAPAVTG